MRRSLRNLSDKISRKEETIDILTRNGFVALHAFVTSERLTAIFRDHKLTRREMTGAKFEIEEWVPDWSVRILYTIPAFKGINVLGEEASAKKLDRVFARCVASTAVKNAVIAAVAAKAPFDFIEAICEEITP
jgi:hypothetical protein